MEDFKKCLALSDGEGMAEAIGSKCNCFGTPKLTEGLDEKELGILTLCGYLTLFELSDWWEQSELKGWDERKKASALFAYNNRGILSQQFEELTGISMSLKRFDFDRNYSLGNRMKLKPNREMFANAGYPWMPDFTAKMGNEHSTIQQTFTRWFVFEVLFKKYPEDSFAGNNPRGGVSFPFI